MFVIAFEIGGKTYYLKNHALAALGCSIEGNDSTNSNVVIFENREAAQKVCDLFKNAKVRERKDNG